jgi:hypothetical protein
MATNKGSIFNFKFDFGKEKNFKINILDIKNEQ